MTNQSLAALLAALRAAGHKPKQSGTGWSCTCPAHDDTSPSLSISVGDDGRALIHCFTGCTPKAICAALGLKLSDLFPPTTGTRRRPTSARRIYGNAKSQAGKAHSVDKPHTRYPSQEAAAQALLAMRLGSPGGTWTYHDATSKPVIRVYRFDTTKPGAKRKKTFRPISLLPSGEWIIGDAPGLMPLFRLPELLAAPSDATVFVLEGERKTEMAAGLGWIATTSFHGSGSARKTDWSSLKDRRVVVLVDNDQPGEKYGIEVAKLALAAGAAEVRVIRLVDLWPDLPVKGDLADLIDSTGGDVEQIDTIRNRIMSRINEVPPAEPLAPEDDNAFVPFPIEVLPKTVRALVVDGARSQQVDPAMLAVPALGVMAAAIGNTRHIQITADWAEYCILWVAVIAKSGAGKSPALKLVTAPLEEVDNELYAKFQKAQDAYELELAAWNAEAQSLKSKGRRPAKPKPIEPQCEHLIVQDPTFEALVGMLGYCPRGVVLVVEELATWFGGFTRYRGSSGRTSSEEARWLPLHGGGMIKCNRVTRQVRARKGSMSILGMVQPGVLATILTRSDYESGLVARFLMATPPQPTKSWGGGFAMPPGVVTDYDAFVRRLASLGAPVRDDGSFESVGIALGVEAAKVWGRFFDGTHSMIAQSDDRTQAMLAKLISSAARLALVIHLGRVADGEVANPNLIDEESMRRGILLAEWFGREGRRANEANSEGEDARASRDLIEFIARRGGAVTARELAQNYTALKGKMTEADEALRTLAEAGFGTYTLDDHGGGPGRRCNRFRLRDTPTIYGNPTSQAEDDISVDETGNDGGLPPGWEAPT